MRRATIPAGGRSRHHLQGRHPKKVVPSALVPPQDRPPRGGGVLGGRPSTACVRKLAASLCPAHPSADQSPSANASQHKDSHLCWLLVRPHMPLQVGERRVPGCLGSRQSRLHPVKDTLSVPPHSTFQNASCIGLGRRAFLLDTAADQEVLSNLSRGGS